MRAPLKKTQGGVMLLEALIGLLIFSIGILALLGMQAIGMRNTIDTKYRSEAAFLANQVVSMMWLDQANMADYVTCTAGRCLDWKNQVEALLPQAATYPPTVVIVGTQATVTVRWRRQGDDTTSQHIVIAQINPAQ